MAQDFESTIKELFGEPLSRLSQFQGEQMQKVMAKVREIARDAVQEDITRLTTEIAELRARVATLEAERVEQANGGL